MNKVSSRESSSFKSGLLLVLLKTDSVPPGVLVPIPTLPRNVFCPVKVWGFRFSSATLALNRVSVSEPLLMLEALSELSPEPLPVKLLRALLRMTAPEYVPAKPVPGVTLPARDGVRRRSNGLAR